MLKGNQLQRGPCVNRIPGCMIYTLTFSYMFEPQEMGMLLHDQFLSKYKAHVWLLFVRLYAHDSCYHKSSPVWFHLKHWTTSKPKLVNLKILGVVVQHSWKGKESSMALSVRNSVFPVLLLARMPLDGAWGWKGRMAAVEILQGHFSNIGPFHCRSCFFLPAWQKAKNARNLISSQAKANTQHSNTLCWVIPFAYDGGGLKLVHC